MPLLFSNVSLSASLEQEQLAELFRDATTNLDRDPRHYEKDRLFMLHEVAQKPPKLKVDTSRASPPYPRTSLSLHSPKLLGEE